METFDETLVACVEFLTNLQPEKLQEFAKKYPHEMADLLEGLAELFELMAENSE